MELHDSHTVRAANLVPTLRRGSVVIRLRIPSLMTILVVTGCAATNASPAAPKLHAAVVAPKLKPAGHANPRLLTISIGRVEFVKRLIRLNSRLLRARTARLKPTDRTVTFSPGKPVFWVANLSRAKRARSIELIVTRVAGNGPHPMNIPRETLPRISRALVEGYLTASSVRRLRMTAGSYQLEYTQSGSTLGGGAFAVEVPGSGTCCY